jgi:hypothetical protein
VLPVKKILLRLSLVLLKSPNMSSPGMSSRRSGRVGQNKAFAQRNKSSAATSQGTSYSFIPGLNPTRRCRCHGRRSSAARPMVGTRSRAIRRRTSKDGDESRFARFSRSKAERFLDRSVHRNVAAVCHNEHFSSTYSSLCSWRSLIRDRNGRCKPGKGLPYPLFSPATPW